MVEIQIQYTGNLRTQAQHGPSGSTIETDAPTDNHGLGQRFSPTDLVAAALGSCVLTLMGIAAQKRGLLLEGTRARVEKHMVSEPARRIGKVVVDVDMPAHLTADQRTFLEHAAYTCPVKKSIHPDIEIQLSFHYPDNA